MAGSKVLDARSNTRGGGTVRIEVWVDKKTGKAEKYAMAYVNTSIHSGDNGRVVGYDNKHVYPGCSSAHHRHWMGQVREVHNFESIDEALDRFQRVLERLSRCYGRSY